MANRVERSVILAASVDEVWAALSEGDRMSAWFGADVSIDPTHGGEAVFRWLDGTKRRAVVETADPPRALTLRWVPLRWLPDLEVPAIDRSSTRIEFRIERAGAGARLTVVEWAGDRSTGPGVEGYGAIRMAPYVPGNMLAFA